MKRALVGVVVGTAVIFVIVLALVGGSGSKSSSPDVAGTTVGTQPQTPVASLAFSGTGKRVSDALTLESGLTRIAMKHSGKGNFIVKLLDDQGQPAGGLGGLDNVLANQVGAWEGEKALRIERPGTYFIDITADGTWEIKIKQ